MNRFFYLIGFSILLTACGSSQDSTVLSSLPGGTPIPSSSSSPGGSNGSGTGGGGSSAGVSAEISTYPTTSGGAFQVSQINNLTLNSNQTFYGLASDSGNIYILLEENEGGGIQHWLYQKLPNGQSTFTTVCSILDDGNFDGGLAWDGTYFYTLSNGSSASFRRFKASNCVEATALNTALGGLGYYLDFPRVVINYDSGSLYWRNNSALLTSNSSTGNILATYDGSMSLGGSSLNLDMMGAFTEKSGIMWSIWVDGGENTFGESPNPLQLWKSSINNSAISPTSWGSLYSLFNSFPYSSEFLGVTTPDNKTLTIATLVGYSSPTLIKFYSIDVSNF